MRLFFLLVISLLISTEYSAQNSIQNGMNNSAQDLNSEYVIIDSDYSFEEAVEGISIPLSIVNNLVLINVFYYSFDEQLHKGQLIVNKEVQEDITEIFEFIKETRFPIEKVIPIIKYDWSDEASTSDNNTTAFNYRFVSGTRIVSNHAYGYAIDINPMQNPYIKRNKVLPPGASYDISVPGTITPDSQLVKEFKERGWSWGGDWRSVKDYQHFEKRIGK